MTGTRMIQRSKAKDYNVMDKTKRWLPWTALDRETACLVFNSKLHVWLSSNCRGKIEYTYCWYSTSVGKCNDMHAIIKDKAWLRLTTKSTLHLVFIYFSNLVIKWVDPNFQPKISSLKEVGRGLPRKLHNLNGCLTTLPKIYQTQPKPDHLTKSTPNQHHHLIYGGSHAARNREHAYHNSFTLCRGLCSVPTRIDFITFQQLENLRIISNHVEWCSWEKL
jgi:hypothetical protein